MSQGQNLPLQLSVCSGATELSRVSTLRGPRGGHMLGHPPAWHESLALAHPGTPVWSVSGPSCLAGPGHSKRGNWGTAAAPRAVPRFFQFLMPAPQVAAWGDSGTATLRMMQVQPPAQPLPPGLATSQASGGKVLGLRGHGGNSPGASHLSTPGPVSDHGHHLSPRMWSLDFVSVL